MRESPSTGPITRRRLLGTLGAGIACTLLGSEVPDAMSGPDHDSDGDGIPDAIERSPAVERRISRTFQGGFEGFEVGRRDLLLDVRYVGEVSVPRVVKRAIRRRFREHGIYLQWLDYPRRYDRERFASRYGNDARRILWARDSFYRREIDDGLKNIALQLVVVPGATGGPFDGRIYSPWADVMGSHAGGYTNGMSFGNRAVVAERADNWEQTRLIFHEIAHLGLCHDEDPANLGVMGANRALTLTDDEWDTFAANLPNIHDGTGYDLLARRCLWFDSEDRA